MSSFSYIVATILSLNSSGQLAVNVGLADGFRLDADGTMHDLGNLGGLSQSNAWGINDYGQVTGQSSISFPSSYGPPCDGYGTEPAFRTEANSAIVAGDNLGTLLGGCRYALGIAINSSGQVVGYSAAGSILSASQHAMLATPSSPMKDLGVIAGPFSTAYAINGSGQIVGSSTYDATLPYVQHAFLTTASGPMQDLGTLGGSYSEASGINASGQIVGDATTAGDTADDGFLYTGGTMYDLNTLIASGSGWTITNGFGINDKGQIVGSGKLLSDGSYHPVRLDPADVAVSILANLLSDATLKLTKGEIASLTAKLNNAIASIQAGLDKQAINQLNAFINSVRSSMKTGKMSTPAGNTLIADANAIIAAL